MSETTNIPDQPTPKKINWERISVIIGILATLGVGGYIQSMWRGIVEDVMVEKIKDKDSNFSHVLNEKADEIAKEKADEVMQAYFRKEASKMALIESFEGFYGNG